MKVEDYEYVEYDEFEDDITLTDDRKEELIKKVKDQIVKESIALHKILRICKNEEEHDFIYKWLAKNEITIRGINVTLTGELEKYEHIKRMGNVELPKPLEPEEQQRLFLKLNNMKKNGVDTDTKEYQDIRQKLIIHNMRLALWTVSVKYGKNLRDFKIEEDDLKQIALESLIKSIDKYDADYGYKFSTYAVPRIYYDVRRKWREEINNDDSKRSEWKRLELFEEEMLKSVNRQPTDEEVKEFLGISDKRLESLKKYINYHLQESLENLNEEEEDLIIGELLDDERIEDIKRGKPILNGIYIDKDEPISQEETRKVDIPAYINLMKKDLKEALDTLPTREKEVLELRFGLDGNKPKTLEEIRT